MPSTIMTSQKDKLKEFLIFSIQNCGLNKSFVIPNPGCLTIQQKMTAVSSSNSGSKVNDHEEVSGFGRMKRQHFSLNHETCSSSVITAEAHGHESKTLPTVEKVSKQTPYLAM